MREIKFRAWDKHRKCMTWPLSDEGGWSDGTVSARSSHSSSDGWYDLPLMQYTGLKDKNGVEVYEGDLTSDYDDGAYPYEIRWNQERAQFTKRRGGTDSTLSDLKHQRVIGNIYENPELLK